MMAHEASLWGRSFMVCFLSNPPASLWWEHLICQWSEATNAVWELGEGGHVRLKVGEGKEGWVSG